MKTIIWLFAFITFSFACLAQDTNSDTMMHHPMGKMEKMKDCVFMKDGKMMMMRSGKMMMMDKEMKMSNGITVMTDGTVKMKNGETRMLKDNECVYMSGKIEMMRMMMNDSGEMMHHDHMMNDSSNMDRENMMNDSSNMRSDSTHLKQ